MECVAKEQGFFNESSGMMSDMDAGDAVENIRQEIEKMQEEYEACNENSENGSHM